MASNVTQGSTRLILIGCAVLLSIGMGLRQSIGLFLTPVTRDLALTAADFTLTIAIQNIVWGLSQAPAGAIADRFGVRVTLVAGTVIYIAGFATMAAADGEMALNVSSVLIGIALSCTASSLALAACARAVPGQSRSKMLGVVAAVGSLGTLIVPLATQVMLKYYAWQIGALFFAALAAAMLPAAFWAGASDKLPVMVAEAKTTMRDTLAQALRHRGFLVMSGAYFGCGGAKVRHTLHARAKKLSRAAESLVYSLTPSGVLAENHPKNRGFGGILRGQKCLQRGQKCPKRRLSRRSPVGGRHPR